MEITTNNGINFNNGHEMMSKYHLGGGKRSIQKQKVSNRYCENTVVMNNKEYKFEKVWRNSKRSTLRDSKGVIFPYPEEGVMSEPDITDFIERLNIINSYLDNKKKYESYDKPKKCLLCDKRDVTTKRYIHNEIVWEDGLVHYVKVHKIAPTIQFKKFIFTDKSNRSIVSGPIDESGAVNKDHKDKDVIRLSRVVKKNTEYVLLERNQILILDALMIHGGYTKRYADVENNFNRYSEHAGFLDFDGDVLSKIIVSGKTTRVDEGDDEIYLPMGMDDMFDYEYIFHTHPPTPRPGGRAGDGILYEFPSIGDIYHFIDHHNDGNVIGSLVVTSEGLYNIRKSTNTPNDIRVDEDDLYKKYQRIFNKIQRESIEEYGVDFDTNMFYSKIAQDTKYIEKLNIVLNTFNIQIDFYPRKKEDTGKWVIDTVFLVFRHNKQKDTKSQ